MIVAPTAGRRLLPARAARERLWHAYAYALNTDQEQLSPSGYGLFPEEFHQLHGRICGAMWNDPHDVLPDAEAFASRWRLRRRDVWDSCRLMEMHDSPGAPRPGALVLSMPLVVYSRPVGLEPVHITMGDPLTYDPMESSPSDIRAAIKARSEAAQRAVDAAEHEWIRSGRLVRVPAQHADPDALVGLARRWIRLVKGWTLLDVARAEAISVPALQSSLRTWRELDAVRTADDAGFSPDR